jgi:enoyl-CoA hydratase
MVLTGDGAAFSAGGDIQTIREMCADKGVRDAILDDHQELFWLMTRLPFASIAAVNGAAVGAGVTVALLCDLVVMAEDAFLSDPRVALGLLDGAGGIVLWPLLTSLSSAKEHLLLGDRVPSAEAHRIGLVNRVVPTEDTVAAALELAHRLAALPPHAVREARRLLNSHIERAAPVLSECARAESECFETEEHRAALDRLSVRLAATSPGES